MTAGRPLSDMTQAIVAAWHDERYLSAAEVAEHFGCSRENVYGCWKRAQKAGQLPSENRDFYFRAQRGQSCNSPYDQPITVYTRGAADPLLRQLRAVHGSDHRRAGDDLTERLARIALSMSRGVRTGEYLA